MTGYMRASEIAKLPVVTLGGEDVAQVKDIVFDTARGSVRCFTLSGRGLLSGPLKRDLPWNKVHALGPDAVMIRNEDALAEDDQTSKDLTAAGGGNVLGARAMTDGGTDLGKIVDVIIETGRTPAVAGYELEAAGRGHQRVLLPVVKPVAVSGEMVLVPDATGEFTAGDLAGFPEAARGLRTRLEGEA
ncbi:MULTISPECIES: PRC-barrel domain-containing protein [unclassified Streptomyces]|uniref:PRC-barrel domain-containing protein n=1 Tax=unclassified Streptomyces TaxID=2593676 RepID=UPI001E48D4A8|nr:MULTISPECIES: PRC-barrel domain-containing protein [unclassified Streptomyces]MCC9711911.1 PRC-barrel domain-containing protein [Streptomyces sp. MNU76]WNZ13214.1 PRC-barrel domain-containing protein [Streptomyces sp. 11x1]